jgi:hypothetical protein
MNTPRRTAEKIRIVPNQSELMCEHSCCPIAIATFQAYGQDVAEVVFSA